MLQKDTKYEKTKINQEIEAKELRVIDPDGNNLGIMSKEKALEIARSYNLDLVEIAPYSNPPVTKIINFDKWRYQKEKEERKNLKTQKAKELKQIQISPRIAKNDLLVKAKQAEKFLENGHKVEIDLKLRGRENINKDWALKKIEEFLNLITIQYKVTMELKKGGRGYIMQISKK